MKPMFPVCKAGAVGVLALSLALAGAGAADAADFHEAEANAVSAAVKAVAPSAPVQAAAVDGDAFVAGSSELTTSIPRVLDEAVELTNPATGSSATLALPLGGSTSAPVLAEDGTVVYANAQESVDVAVQALDGGVRAQTVIGADATADQFA